MPQREQELDGNIAPLKMEKRRHGRCLQRIP